MPSTLPDGLCLLSDGRRRPILNVNSPNLIYVDKIPAHLSFKTLRDSVVGVYGRARFIETFEAWTKRPIGKIIVEFAEVDSLDKFEAALRNREVLEYSEFQRLQNKPQFFAHVQRETGVDLLGCAGIPRSFNTTSGQQQPRQPPPNVRMSSGGRPPSAANGGAHNHNNQPAARPPSRAFADRTRPQFPNNPDAQRFVSKWGNNNGQNHEEQQQQHWGDNNNGEQHQSPFSRADRSTEVRSPPPFRSTNNGNGNTSSTADSWSNTSTPPNNNGFGRRGGWGGRGGGFAAAFGGRGGRGRGTSFMAAFPPTDNQNNTEQNGFVNGVGGDDASANTDNQNTQQNGFVNGGDASANIDNQNSTQQNGFVNGGDSGSSDLLLSHDEMVRTNASVSVSFTSSPQNSASSPSVEVVERSQQQQSPVFSQYRVPRVRRSSGGDDEEDGNVVGPKKTLLVCKLVPGFDMLKILEFLQCCGDIDISGCEKRDEDSASFTFPEAVFAQNAMAEFLRGTLEPVVGPNAEARLI